MSDEDVTIDPRVEAQIRRRQTIRLGVIAALIVVAAALVLDNLHDVTIGWVFGDTDAPLVIVLLVVLALGLAIGWLTGRSGRQPQS